jgi:hypothetical protein
MAGQGAVPIVGTILLALLLCGLLGVLGQGVRAIVGLKNAGSLNSTTPTEQAEFSLAYLVLSLMIGFIAGILAGIALNLETIIAVDPSNWKLLLGIAGSGYIGADFIENTMSVVIPGTKAARAGPPSSPVSAPPAQAPLPPPPATPAHALAPTDDGAAALSDAMRAVCPQANATLWVPALTAAFDRFNFSNERRRAAAMGQFLVEAGPALNETVEDLDYSPERACQVWPALFTNPAAAQPYCADPRLFADHVYAGVNGNGRRGERRRIPLPWPRPHPAHRARRIRGLRPGDRQDGRRSRRFLRDQRRRGLVGLLVSRQQRLPAIG